MIEPRAYQKNCVDKNWKAWRAGSLDQLNKLPTASGKTIIFTLLLEKLFNHHEKSKAIILVNRVNLVDQTIQKLNILFKSQDLGMYCGTLGEYDINSKITVASVDTLKRITPDPTVLIIDEAHNAYKNSSYNSLISRMREANPKLRIARFTATDFTAQHGYIWGKGKSIEKILYKKTMKEMIALGYILPPIFKSSKESFDLSEVRVKGGEFIMKDLLRLTADEAKLKKQVADAIPKLKGRKKIVWACTSIEHANAVQKEVSKYEKITVIHSKLNESEKRMNMDDFENGDVKHIASVTMVSEGYDFPPLDAVVCLRPTRSPVLFVQLVGRILRLYLDKINGLFLDYGKIVENLGHPNNPFVKNDSGKKKVVSVLICPACETISFAPCKVCTCGYEFFTIAQKKKGLTNNLTSKSADPEFSDNLYPVLEVDCLGWEIDTKYISKSGSKRIQIKYKTMTKTVYEYLQPRGEKAVKLKDQYKKAKGKFPKKIRVEKQNKWWKILERIF